MPWKLIGFIVILVLVALFASLNLTNKADISLGFHVFKDVPIFLSLLFTFLAGALVMVPFTIGPGMRKIKARRLKKAENEEKAASLEAPDEEPDSKKKKKKKKKKNAEPEIEIPPEETLL